MDKKEFFATIRELGTSATSVGIKQATAHFLSKYPEYASLQDRIQFYLVLQVMSSDLGIELYNEMVKTPQPEAPTEQEKQDD